MPVSKPSASRRWILLGAAIVVAAVGIVSSHASAKSASVRGSLAQAASAAVPKTTISPAAGRVLGGLTSQHSPVIMEISKNAKRIDLAAANLELTCTSGDQFWIPDGWGRTPLSANGSVNLHVTVPPQTSGGSNGVTLTGGSDTFSGKLNRKAATFSGTWRLQLTYSMTSTTGTTPTTDSCDSGAVTVKAKL
jgi:hypothetical protein